MTYDYRASCRPYLQGNMRLSFCAFLIQQLGEIQLRGNEGILQTEWPNNGMFKPIQQSNLCAAVSAQGSIFLSVGRGNRDRSGEVGRSRILAGAVAERPVRDRTDPLDILVQADVCNEFAGGAGLAWAVTPGGDAALDVAAARTCRAPASASA